MLGYVLVLIAFLNDQTVIDKKDKKDKKQKKEKKEKKKKKNVNSPACEYMMVLITINQILSPSLL